MDGKILARIGAVVFVAVAATAAVLDMTRKDEPAAVRPAPQIVIESVDPLREALVRCQEKGEAAAADADCLTAWAENRRRFLGQSEGR